MAASHAFLDILANTQVRDAYLAGRISVILSSDLETILWANGAGASFLGFRTVADSIGVDSGFDNLTRLQIESGLATNRGVKIGGIPSAQSFLVNTIEMEHLGEVIFLRSIAAVASDGGFVDLTSGLGDEFTEAAVLDLSGNILSATAGFRPDFSIDDELIALLHDAQSGNGIKKCLLKNYSDMPVGILELNKKPAIFLLIAAKPQKDNINLEQNKTKEDFVFDPSCFPLRFAWQVDENSFFTDVSPELEIAVGPRFGDILEKSFTSLAKEWNMDSNGAMRALLKSHKAWSERKIYWPVEGGETRVEIEFSALPIYSRNREFNGYRGFGVINEAKMTAKEEGLNLARNRGPKGLTIQEHEAFTAIARKLKADILAVELPKNLRAESNEINLAPNVRHNKNVENVISNQKENVGHNVISKNDAERQTISVLQNQAKDHSDDVRFVAKLPESKEQEFVVTRDDRYINEVAKPIISPGSVGGNSNSDNNSDQLCDENDIVNGHVISQVNKVAKATTEKNEVVAIVSDSLNVVEEDNFVSSSSSKSVNEKDDSSIISLDNNNDEKPLVNSDKNKHPNITIKLPVVEGNSTIIDQSKLAHTSHEYDLNLASGSDDDVETVLEKEWANEDDLISDPLQNKPEQLDVEPEQLDVEAEQLDVEPKQLDEEGAKENGTLSKTEDEMQTALKSSQVSTSFSQVAQTHNYESKHVVDNISNDRIIDAQLNTVNDDLELHDFDQKIAEEISLEVEPKTIDEALAALRRSLEANGVEAVKLPVEDEHGFSDEMPGHAMKNDVEVSDNASLDDLAANINELMHQSMGMGDNNKKSSSALASNEDEYGEHEADPLSQLLYPKDNQDAFAEGNELSIGFDHHQSRLNLRPADKLEKLDKDDGSKVKSDNDEALPILPSPRIEFNLLQHLPLPILIYRDNRVLFASDELLRLTGFPTLDSFRAHGILSVILREWLPRNILIGSNDNIWSVRPQMRGVTWADGLEASMISFGNLEKQERIDREDFEALERKAVELSILLNLISDGVLILDDTGLIHSVNEAGQRMLGLEANEIKGRNFLHFFNKKSSDIISQFFNDVRQSDEKPAFGQGYEVQALRSDGENISLFASFGKMELEDGYFLMMRDLTIMHSAASELMIARHQAEEESLRKSRYLALVSHEIRTPLNAIIGLSELILEEKFGSLNSERYRGYLRDIINSGGHIMTLINDLLDAAKIAEGGTKIDIATVSIVPILKEVLGLMAPQANTGRIIMRSNIAHNLPNIAADKRSVKQIILNLLSNAIRFTPPGGQIIVSALPKDNAGVLLRIRDSGIGMSESDISEAMLPFHQISNPVKNSDDINNFERGTGLGLPLTKALADANNARFTLHSETGKGTVAEVIFPLAVNILDDEQA